MCFFSALILVVLNLVLVSYLHPIYCLVHMLYFPSESFLFWIFGRWDETTCAVRASQFHPQTPLNFFLCSLNEKTLYQTSTAIIVYENCEHLWNSFFHHFEHITRIIQTYVWTFFYIFVWQNTMNVPFLLWNSTLTAFLQVFFCNKI